MLVTTSPAALAAGEKVELRPGDTLRVVYAVSYRVAEEVSVNLWASLYQRTLGIVNRLEQAQTKEVVRLAASASWKPYQGVIDIQVGEVGAGSYGLLLEMPGTGVSASVDDAVTVAGTGIADMLGPLMGIMVMTMMMGMVEEG